MVPCWAMWEDGGTTVSEENKALARRLIEQVYNDGNLEVIDEIVAEDYFHHDPTMPQEEGHGREHLKEFTRMYRSAFPDLHVQIEDQVAEEDKVVVRWVANGTHEGDLMGVDPTGNRVTMAGMTIYRIDEGKIAETWDNYDAMGMMQQLGVIPSPEEAKAQ